MIRPNTTVVFVNEASSEVGIGHLLRSQNLAREMMMRGYPVVGVTIGDQKAVIEANKESST